MPHPRVGVLDEGRRERRRGHPGCGEGGGVAAPPPRVGKGERAEQGRDVRGTVSGSTSIVPNMIVDHLGSLMFMWFERRNDSLHGRSLVRFDEPLSPPGGTSGRSSRTAVGPARLMRYRAPTMLRSGR